MIPSTFKTHTLAMLLDLLAENSKQNLDDIGSHVAADIIADKKHLETLLQRAIIEKTAGLLH